MYSEPHNLNGIHKSDALEELKQEPQRDNTWRDVIVGSEKSGHAYNVQSSSDSVSSISLQQPQSSPMWNPHKSLTEGRNPHLEKWLKAVFELSDSEIDWVTLGDIVDNPTWSNLVPDWKIAPNNNHTYGVCKQFISTAFFKKVIWKGKGLTATPSLRVKEIPTLKDLVYYSLLSGVKTNNNNNNIICILKIMETSWSDKLGRNTDERNALANFTCTA